MPSGILSTRDLAPLLCLNGNVTRLERLEACALPVDAKGPVRGTRRCVACFRIHNERSLARRNARRWPCRAGHLADLHQPSRMPAGRLPRRPKAFWRSFGVSLVRRSMAALRPRSRAAWLSLRFGRFVGLFGVLAVPIVQTFYQVQTDRTAENRVSHLGAVVSLHNVARPSVAFLQRALRDRLSTFGEGTD
jgi:hypothetical protein